MRLQTTKRPDLLCDSRWRGHQGIARFSENVLQRLPGVMELPPGSRLFHPLDPIWLSRVIAKLQPRVYFSPGFNPPISSKRPFVFVVHDLNYVRCRENSDALRRAYFELIVRPACRRAVKVLTVSEFSRRQIVEWARISPDRVLNVSAGVDASFTDRGARYAPGFSYVLYVGNRLPHKNLPRLFQAFAIAGGDCKLMLSGSPDRHTIELARKHGVEHAIRFSGIVSNDALPALYRGARAVVLPSLFEGFGLPVLEAMACGVPVLASNRTSIPEVAGDGALLVDPESIDEIADGLTRVIGDSSLRARLVASGLQQAAKFSWDTTAQSIMTLLAAID